VTLTFIDAGHILGSAQVLLEVNDQSDGKKKRFLFSGDVGRGGNEVLRDPVPVGRRFPADGKHLRRPRARGTSGHGRSLCGNHPPGIQARRQDPDPAFAVERTQQVLYVLNDLFERDEIPEVPGLCGQPAGGERHRDLPPAPGCLQR
jgi:metallo-beta-lactamase family protein